MKISTCVPALLTGALLALAGCDGAPMAPRTDTAEVPPRALLAEPVSSTAMARRSQCVNNLKQMGLGFHNRHPLGLIMHDPSIDVELGDDSRAAGSFFGHLLVGEDGEACGTAQLEFDTGDLILLFISGGTMREEHDHLVVTFEGEAELCQERDERCHAAPFTGEVRVPAQQGLGPGDGRLYIAVGDVNSYEFEARMYLLLPGQGEGGRLTLSDGPTTLWMDDEKIGSAGIRLTGQVGTAAVHGGAQFLLADGSVRIFTVLLGLLLHEGDGYRWVFHILPQMDQPIDGQGQRPASRIVGSELLLRSGPTLQDDDTWIIGGVVYIRDKGDWICL